MEPDNEAERKRMILAATLGVALSLAAGSPLLDLPSGQAKAVPVLDAKPGLSQAVAGVLGAAKERV